MKMICAPITPEAMTLLDVNKCPDFLLESILLTDDEYELIQKSGAIEKINSSLGKIIDDYEDEAIITSEELIKTRTILETHLTFENANIMTKIINLNTLAIKKHTGLFFFF